MQLHIRRVMQLHINSMKFIRTVFRSADTLSLKAVSRKNMPFFIGWIATFIWLYSYFLPMGGFRFESKLYYDNVGYSQVYTYIWLIIGCLIPVFIDGEDFVPKTFYSVIIVFTCSILIRYTGVTMISKGMMFIAVACFGHIFASNLYAFFMILNNSEKFYSMILAVLLPKVLMLAKPGLNHVIYVLDLPSMIISVIIIILAVCSYFYKYTAVEIPVCAKIKVPSKAYSLMPLIFVVLTLNDVMAPAGLRQIADILPNQIEGYYFFGIMLGTAAVVLLQKHFSINLCNMLNISFALLAVGFTANIISHENSGAAVVSAVCSGISYAVGIVNIYYLVGLMTKKFQSITFYRAGIILSAIYYFAAFIVLEVLKDSRILAPSTFIAFTSICIVVLFFVLSPFFIKMLYSGEWIDDSYRSDVTECSRLEAKLKDYKLTPAEIEVCKLLLDGCTLRQISGIQSKAYATINTYCTSIYRKLNINSRTELLLFLQSYIEK